MITTSQNKQIKQVVKLLKSSRERKKTGLFVIEGPVSYTHLTLPTN